MITEIAIIVLHSVILALTSPLRLLPDVTISGEFAAAIITFNGYFSVLGIVLPLSTILTSLGLILAFEGFVFTARLIVFVIKKIPTIS